MAFATYTAAPCSDSPTNNDTRATTGQPINYPRTLTGGGLAKEAPNSQVCAQGPGLHH